MRASKYSNKFNVIDGTVIEVKRVKVFQFDVLDMNSMLKVAAHEIHRWKTSEEGSWIMDHSIGPPEWSRFIEPQTFSSRHMLSAKLIDRDYTFWALKWNSGGLIS